MASMATKPGGAQNESVPSRRPSVRTTVTHDPDHVLDRPALSAWARRYLAILQAARARQEAQRHAS